MVEKRKQNSLDIRLTPCEVCDFPLTHRHHLLAFVENGESNYTIQLCATCHELLHIAMGAIIHKKRRATEVYTAFRGTVGANSELIKKIEDLVYSTAELNWEMGIKYSDY